MLKVTRRCLFSNELVAGMAAQQATLFGVDLTQAYDPSIPVEGFQTALLTLHDAAGLDWSTSLLVTAGVFRAATFPIFSGSLKKGWQRAAAATELKDLRTLAREAVLLRDKNLVMDVDREYRARLSALGLTNNPFTGMGYMLLVQAPFTLTMIMAMRGMSSRIDYFPSFILDSKLGWCDSLALPDPFGIFPLLYATSLVLGTYRATGAGVLNSGSESATAAIDNSVYVNYAVRAACFVFLPLAMELPASMVIFFLFNSIFTRISTSLLPRTK